MPEQYFGGAPTAFQGGMLFGAADRARRLRENALNALIGRFGPEAADPQSLALLQQTQQQAQLFPHELAEAERVGAARAAEVGQYGVGAGDPAVLQRDIALRTAAATRAAAVLQMTKQRKGDLGQAFDLVQRVLPEIGIPAENLAKIREAIIADPDKVDELVALLQDPSKASGRRLVSGGQPMYDDQGRLRWVVIDDQGNAQAIQGFTPANAAHAAERIEQGDRRLELGWSNLDWDKIKELLPARTQGVQHFVQPDGRVVADVVPGSPAEVELETKLRDSEVADRKMQLNHSLITQRGAVIKTNADRALQYFSGASGGIIPQNWRRLAPLAAGTEMHEAWQALEALKNNISIEEIQEIRQSSPTGASLGNVSDRDIDLLKGSLGRLENIRDPKLLVEEINAIMGVFQKIEQFAAQDANSAVYRTQLREQRGKSFGPQPRPTPRPGGSNDPEPTLEELLSKYGTSRRR